MQKYINTSGIPLSLGVFLATDHYDHNEDPNHISTTALIRPLRQVILAARVPQHEAVSDLGSMIASRMGTAIHDGIERAWKGNYAVAMEAIGIPKAVISRVKINPKPEELTEDTIPVYMEQREFRQFMGYVISGQVDFIGQGQLEDFKTTSVYGYINQSIAKKHLLQLSIYRWLNPEKITNDQAKIIHIFTDWSAMQANQSSVYPQARFVVQNFNLMSLAETEAYIRNKLTLIQQYWNAKEHEIPLCTDEDLWRKEPQFKYYKNPDKTLRSTKNFETMQDAMQRYREDGSIGIVKQVPGQVTACKFCAAFSVCSQKDQLIAAGDLIL